MSFKAIHCNSWTLASFGAWVFTFKPIVFFSTNSFDEPLQEVVSAKQSFNANAKADTESITYWASGKGKVILVWRLLAEQHGLTNKIYGIDYYEELEPTMKYGQIYHQTQYPVLQTWKENAYTTSDEGEEYEQPTGESNSYQQQRNPETAHEKVQHGLRPIHMLADTCTINQNLHEERNYVLVLTFGTTVMRQPIDTTLQPKTSGLEEKK